LRFKEHPILAASEDFTHQILQPLGLIQEEFIRILMLKIVHNVNYSKFYRGNVKAFVKNILANFF